jgi:UDP-N-acetylglucosamine 1-carboxyvinyltransferase
VLKSIGVTIEWNNDVLTLKRPDRIPFEKLDVDAAIKTRSIIMFLGPFIHECSHFQIPQAGGCKLGSRTVRPHFFALEALGVKIKTLESAYDITVRTLKKNKEIILYESGDTVTENALMAASRIDGKTVIKFASANYMVQDLCHFLVKLGVRIEGIGTTTLTVFGKKDICADLTFTPGEDPIESMLFLSIAATTNSSITIEACPIDFLELELLKLEKMGFKYKILKRYISKNGYTKLADIKTFPSRLRALEEKLEARPFPGLNIDNLPFFVPIAAIAKGQTLIHDWVYENRAIYYMELTKLGADMVLADPHRVYINGSVKFKSAEIVCPPALRPAAIILIAMLAAPGVSILRNVYSINRGYEDLATRLTKLGAKIEILNS